MSVRTNILSFGTGRRLAGRRGGQRGGQRGMTLIEVAAAVALLVVMGVLVYSGLAITVRSQHRGEVLQERYHAARVFLQRIKLELSEAFVSLHQAPDRRTKTLFVGDQSHLVFDTSAYEPIRRNAHESDQMEVGYTLGTDDKGRPAIIRRVKHYIDDRPGEGGHEEVVISGVTEFSLEYYDTRQQEWKDDWDVEIDDANTARTLLKQLEYQRDLARTLANTPQTGLAGMAAGQRTQRQVDARQNQAQQQLFLPNRVRIRLGIEDNTGREYLLETQAEIRVTTPLWY